MGSLTGIKMNAADLERHRSYKNPHMKGLIDALIQAMNYEKDPINKKAMAEIGITLNGMTLK